MDDKDRTKEQLLKDLQDLRRRYSEMERLYSEYRISIERLNSFEKALETMQLGVTITDTEGRILYVNPAECFMHGYSIEELRDNNVKIFSENEIRAPLSMEKIKSMKRWKRESINKRKDGSLFPVQLMSDVVTNSEGIPIGIITTCEDITIRNNMETEIKERIDELEKFYEMSVNRELKMKELKEELKKLKAGAANSNDGDNIK